MIENEKIASIARVCHEANRAYCITLGDNSHSYWQDAPDWQRKSAINGVLFHIANPSASDSAAHDRWMCEKVTDGWTYGVTKDLTLKRHPCILPFDQLPAEQQLKDRLFRAVVHAMRGMPAKRT